MEHLLHRLYGVDAPAELGGGAIETSAVTSQRCVSETAPI